MKIVHLISGPRNISTSLMYAFNNRTDCIAVDEPFYAHYLKQTKLKHPGAIDILREMPTEEQQIVNELLHPKAKPDILFIKNMASHVALLESRFYHKTLNVFLIRDTDAVIKSFAKVVPDLQLADIGIQQEAMLYQDLFQIGQNPPIIDSGELLKNPRKILKQLCLQLAIPFSEDMLSWPVGPKPIDGMWAKYWYASTHQSSQFEKPLTIKKEPIPEQYEHLAREARKYYKQLFKHAIKA